MRPPVPDLAVPRSRKASLEQQWTDPRSAAPATFFLARSHDTDGEISPDEIEAPTEHLYGVQSLEEVVTPKEFSSGSSSTRQPLVQDEEEEEEEEREVRQTIRRRSTLKPSDMLTTNSVKSSRFPLEELSSRPLTPLTFDHPDDHSSLPSSPRSISNHSIPHLDDISIADDLSSQAVASAEEDDDYRSTHNPISDNTSQLIMPSIKMPSRKPFTDRGKALGRLKVLVAGAPGSGKSSLIQSIFQACEDIVHMDDFPSVSPSRILRSLTPSQASHSYQFSQAATAEIYASTKPYPSWWSDLEDSRVLRRRKSTGDIVLERNICFVDTPATSMGRSEQTESIIQYIRQQLSRATTAISAMNHDFQNLLAGNGGTQVDAVLYLISEETLLADMECIRRLCDWTNVIPLIAKADLLTHGDILALKSSFHKQAQTLLVKPFLLGSPSTDSEDYDGYHGIPFAVSSAKASNDEVMDASTLMSPDYVQPLVPSELMLLVQRIFDGENIAWMRHSAAKKLALQQQKQPSQEHSHLPLSALTVTHSARRSSPTYTMARLADHTRQEEGLARVQLAKWASDLQQSLQNERERYAAMARGERAIWLTERIGECVVEGSLIPITQSPGFCGLHGPAEKGSGSGVILRTANGHNVEYQVARLSSQDPLGVVRWSEDLRRRGWTVVQIVGSFGVVGGLAFCLAKAWGFPSRTLCEWHLDWYNTSN
ncbi:uncharacterized protein BO97DRAFT_378769 [Aspergillus homomorphus CBS 101889]|uniref:Septin-type G domain-containing protein n=1 Tax=Aspergillus homomorphus (strain CBS 101889) TaxID=1450537 RepID=A0A395HIH4_ASPHC|nr:hypothetical protein BO97DRAFT_378769 [Aspergillus homomorphus CBS 101889]RAL07303.1 hypothetical protein BO97DRAFT_378769 [Aspergillus homomorphus CBS 101889]